jgi:hypothetical protein
MQLIFIGTNGKSIETDRDGLIMSAAQRYARKYFPEFMTKAAKMVEPIDESKVNEGKDDFVARHSGTNIILKKGYKYHTGEELTKLYNKIGELVKDDLHVKDVIIAFENGINEARGSNTGTF